jgi:hypothetical protein
VENHVGWLLHYNLFSPLTFSIMSKTPPPITPAFAWALPDTDNVFRKAKESPKPVPNPLLSRTPPKVRDHTKLQNNGQVKKMEVNSDSMDVRSPFSSLLNITSNLRQRRKSPDQSFPPKLSITDGPLDITILKSVVRKR